MEKPSESVLHIGYPKSASTSLQKFLRNHPQVAFDHVTMGPLSASSVADVSPEIRKLPDDGRVHVLSNEKISESLIFMGDSRVWHRNKFIPGTWDQVASEIRIDPEEAALRVRIGYGSTKILIIVRDQVDWLQSAYKYFLSRLPQRKRSFRDFCETPRGKVYLAAGYFDRTVEAYAGVFDPHNVKVMRLEYLIDDSEEFARALCQFLGVQNVPVPIGTENRGSTNTSATLRARFPFVDKLPSRVRKLGSNVLTWSSSDNSPILSEMEINEIRERYAASNERLALLLEQKRTVDPPTGAVSPK